MPQQNRGNAMLFAEKLEDVPEADRGDYVESEYEGKKGFQHKKVVALANAYRSEHERRSQLESTLAEQEAKRLADVEKAREEERQKALKENNLERVLEIERQKTADAVERAKLEGKQAALKELAAERAKERKSALIERFKQKGVDEHAKAAIALILDRMIDINLDTQQEVFLDVSGKAMAVDVSGFDAEIDKMPLFAHLIEKKQSTSGAGGANGYGNAGTVQKKFEEMNGAELSALRKQNPAEYERLKADYHSRGK